MQQTVTVESRVLSKIIVEGNDLSEAERQAYKRFYGEIYPTVRDIDNYKFQGMHITRFERSDY